jgi:hypothetical protein
MTLNHLPDPVKNPAPGHAHLQAIFSLDRDDFLAKVPRLYLVLASANTTSPYFRAVSIQARLRRYTVQFTHSMTIPLRNQMARNAEKYNFTEIN